MRKEKKSNVNDKQAFQDVLEMYRNKQRFEQLEAQYKQEKEKLSTRIRNYMYSHGYSSFDFRSREFGNVKVNHVVRKMIKWDVTKLKAKLSPELCAEIIEKEYYISDIQGLVKYLKSCGVNPKKFKRYLIITEKVNQKKMDELSEIGDITASDVEGCYELKEANGYLTINVKKDEDNE